MAGYLLDICWTDERRLTPTMAYQGAHQAEPRIHALGYSDWVILACALVKQLTRAQSGQPSRSQLDSKQPNWHLGRAARRPPCPYDSAEKDGAKSSRSQLPPLSPPKTPSSHSPKLIASELSLIYSRHNRPPKKRRIRYWTPTERQTHYD